MRVEDLINRKTFFFVAAQVTAILLCLGWLDKTLIDPHGSKIAGYEFFIVISFYVIPIILLFRRSKLASKIIASEGNDPAIGEMIAESPGFRLFRKSYGIFLFVLSALITIILTVPYLSGDLVFKTMMYVNGEVISGPVPGWFLETTFLETFYEILIAYLLFAE